MEVKYPNVHVQLVGRDGNVFTIIGRVCTAMKKAGVDKDEIDKFRNLCFTADSYDAVLQLCIAWVDCY